jgi:hypothetical protein
MICSRISFKSKPECQLNLGNEWQQHLFVFFFVGYRQISSYFTVLLRHGLGSMAILQSSLFLFVCFQSIKASFSQVCLINMAKTINLRKRYHAGKRRIQSISSLLDQCSIVAFQRNIRFSLYSC